VAGEAEQLRGEERTEQCEKRDSPWRQQHEEDRRRDRPVQNGDRELRQRQRRRRQRKLYVAKPDRPQVERCCDDIADADQHQQPPKRRDDRHHRQAQISRQRTSREAETANQEQAKPEGDDVREDDPRELLCGNPPTRVEAVANGGT
jgi:hypothetical protein